MKSYRFILSIKLLARTIKNFYWLETCATFKPGKVGKSSTFSEIFRACRWFDQKLPAPAISGDSSKEEYKLQKIGAPASRNTLVFKFKVIAPLCSTDKVSSLQSSSGLFAIKYKLQFVDQLNFYLIISPQTEASSSFLKILILVRRLEGLSFPMGKTFWLFGEALFQEEAFNSPILANISCLIWTPLCPVSKDLSAVSSAVLSVPVKIYSTSDGH